MVNLATLALSAGSLLATAEEEGHGVELSDGGLLAQYAWLMVVLPFVAALVITLYGKRTPRGGAWIAVGTVGFVLVYGLVLLISHWATPIAHTENINIATIGQFDIEWGVVVDGLSIMMFFVVGAIATASFTYAVSYMEGDIRETAFWASFSLFAGAMLVLVSAANILQMLVGWELVGLASYLLIGHYWEEKENSSAAMKAFLVNKVADVGLIIGVLIPALIVGSFRFHDILGAAVEGNPGLVKYGFIIGLLLFIGAMGKSAQFPFHVWLPDAMAGPTPVSALMHAATMVTAGVYLLGRMFPFYNSVAIDVLPIVMWIGGITMLIAGLLAIVQDDIKRVLAYSTVSQLGYMVAAMGAGAYTAGLFHLFTHAFFKSLLFLGAGSVIHAVHSNNMSDMGGLRKYMPTTFWTFGIGSLALAGFPLLAGFFSKDEVLASLNYASSHGTPSATFVMWIGIVTAFITAFYMARAVFLTFFGEYKGDPAHEPHESPRLMTVPLQALAVGAIVAGYFNVPGIFTPFTDWLSGREFAPGDHHAESFDILVLVLGSLAGLIGIAIGYSFFFADGESQEARDRRFRLPGPIHTLLVNKYYIDDFYMLIVNFIKRPLANAANWLNGLIDAAVSGTGILMSVLGKFVYEGLDQRGIDASINAIGGGTGEAGGALRYIQTGKVQQYAAALFIGVLLLAVGFFIVTSR
ncbi:MAG: NADH-quinone oxidoreductase subunit L [Acidimicrobiia bacterium]|nr:NADH-quinone oxidoreductase subunit L [Acidimicrobiia bacterium]